MIILLLFCFTDITDILKVWKQKKECDGVICFSVKNNFNFVCVHNSFIVSVFEIL